MLIDPRNNIPFYVGKGKHDRVYHHVRDVRCDSNHQSNKAKCKIIKEILDQELNVKYEKIHSNLPNQEACEFEKQLINSIGTIKNKTGPLTNWQPGGEAGGCTTKRTIICYSMDGKELHTYNSIREASEITGIHTSSLYAALTGIMSRAGNFKWAYKGQDIKYIKNISKNKPITQYSFEGVKIRDFESVIQAATILNINPSAINDACHGRTYSSAGYRWAHQNKLLIMPDNPKLYRDRAKTYSAIDNQGNIIGTYKSILEAGKALGIKHPSGINEVCRGKVKRCGGYFWKVVFNN